MKKIKKSNRLLSAILTVSACCTLSVVCSPAFAAGEAVGGLVPSGYGYSHGAIPVMNEVGGASIHDSDMMRYDRNQRLNNKDYYQYEQNVMVLVVQRLQIQLLPMRFLML